ncbi:hypothetical protein Lal_00049484 [Lupinus albus]|nr:hypothetical protein Lal_00049484 [Lupinus albus]
MLSVLLADTRNIVNKKICIAFTWRILGSFTCSNECFFPTSIHFSCNKYCADIVKIVVNFYLTYPAFFSLSLLPYHHYSASGSSSQIHGSLSNTRLSLNGNSNSLGFGSNSGRITRFFGPSSSNNRSTSLWGSENNQVSPTIEEKEFPNGQILDIANLTVLNSHSIQRFEEWQTEVNFLGRLSHPNLVKLLGLGREDSKLFLVYEFMNRGSLDNHIYGRGAGVEPLSWDTRLKIMIGAAKGLAFLHTLEKRIIYRDLKPSNILLDKLILALARSIPYPDQSHITTRVMGTIGYAAPEYLISGNLYVKSDVYAFGIVLLEMLTGLRIRDIIMRLSQPHSSLQNWLKSSLLNRGKMRSNMDARLEGKYPPKLALEVAQISLKCIQTNVKVKPSMVEVVERLEKIEAANEKPADSMRRGTRSRVVQQHRRPDDG